MLLSPNLIEEIKQSREAEIYLTPIQGAALQSEGHLSSKNSVLIEPGIVQLEDFFEKKIFIDLNKRDGSTFLRS